MVGNPLYSVLVVQGNSCRGNLVGIRGKDNCLGLRLSKSTALLAQMLPGSLQAPPFRVYELKKKRMP